MRAEDRIAALEALADELAGRIDELENTQEWVIDRVSRAIAGAWREWTRPDPGLEQEQGQPLRPFVTVLPDREEPAAPAAEEP